MLLAALAVIAAPKWSTTTWEQTRERLGSTRDRRGALAYLIQAGYAPLDWQRRAHLQDSGSRRTHKLAVCGLGSGKTEWGVAEAIILAIMNPGRDGVITAPTYDLLTEEIVPRFLERCEQLAEAGTPILRRYHKTRAYAELWCGGRVYFRSLQNVHNLRGREFAWAWVDEIETLINATLVWDVLSGRVRQRAHIRQVYATSTPRGLRGCVELFVQARARIRGAESVDVDGVDCVRVRDGADWVTVPRVEALRSWLTVRATSEDNPHLPADYLDGIRATYSKRRWDEEVLALILKPETAVWPEIDADLHLVSWPAPSDRKFDRTLPYDIVYDAGDSFPHVLWIQRWVDGTCVVVDELCEDGWPLSKLHDEILRRSALYGRQPENVIADRAVKSEIGWLMDVFPKAVAHRMRTRASQSVMEGVELVRDRLDPIAGLPKLIFARRLAESNCSDPKGGRTAPRRGIWRCMREYRHKLRSDGTISPEPYKDNVHDHGADCVRMHQVALFGPDQTAINTIPRRYHEANENRLRGLHKRSAA